MSLFDKAVNSAGQSVIKSYKNAKSNSFQMKQLKKVWDKADTEYDVPMPEDINKAGDWEKDKKAFQQKAVDDFIQNKAQKAQQHVASGLVGMVTELPKLLTKLSGRMSQQQTKPQPYQPPTPSADINPFFNTRDTLQLPGQSQTKLPQLRSATVPF